MKIANIREAKEFAKTADGLIIHFFDGGGIGAEEPGVFFSGEQPALSLPAADVLRIRDEEEFAAVRSTIACGLDIALRTSALDATRIMQR